jgi:hypothetical protein
MDPTGRVAANFTVGVSMVRIPEFPNTCSGVSVHPSVRSEVA